MSQRLGGSKLLNKPVTRKELLDVLAVFEHNFRQGLWDVLPWYKKVWRKIRGYYRTKRRKARVAQDRVARSKTGQPQAPRGNRTTQVGESPTTHTSVPTDGSRQR